MAWYDNNWSNRFKVTSDNTKVTAAIKGLAIDLSNAPAGFWSAVKSDGSDIRVTTSNGTTLVARDVVSIDTTGQTGLLRVDTSSISTSADTDFYVYYGNASATEPGSTGTYDANLVAYLPLEGGVTDKIGTYTPSINGSPTYESGYLGKSGLRSGTSTSNRVEISSTTYRSTFVAYSFLFSQKGAKPTSGSMFVIASEKSSDKTGITVKNLPEGFTMSYDRCGIGGQPFINFLPSSSYTVGQVYHGMCIWDFSANRMLAYVNGSLVDDIAMTVGGGICSYTDAFWLFNRATSNLANHDTALDEFCLWNKKPTANETLTLSNNELNNDTFWTFGAQEESDSFAMTTNAASNLFSDQATLNGEVSDLE